MRSELTLLVQDDAPATELKRSLGLLLITLYGVGTIVGGAFYALTGQVAAHAGMLTPLAFLVAAIIAIFSAFSFAELSARFPFSAGEAHYVSEAFRRKSLSAAVGWMVIATGVVSAATLADAFAGFVGRFADLPEGLVITLMVLSLGAVSAWGISESAWLVLVITLVEVGGLIVILVLGVQQLTELADCWRELTPTWSWAQWSGVFFGAYLAFYSFIGFEDVVNVAEEVQEPQRNLPWAILISVVLTAGLYVAVSLVTVLAASQEQLVASSSPLSLALGDWPGAGDAIAEVGMLAGINGALVQMVMASRVAYGLAGKGFAPQIFRRVHPRTRTPLAVTTAATCVVPGLALWFPLTTLAKATSTILLVVFALVNFSLWRIKLRDREPPEKGPCYPLWLPVCGSVNCVAFIAFQLTSLWSASDGSP